MVSQCRVMVEMPIQTMAPKGSSDFRIPLRPPRENICFSFPAGFIRSGLKCRASGANTRPPCARPPATESTHAVTTTGTTQRNTPQLAQNRSGPPRVNDWSTERSSVFCNKPRHCRAIFGTCHATKVSAPPQAIALESSRLRATCPCSRAFFRFCGVAFSVLLESAMFIYRARCSSCSAYATDCEKYC